MAKSKAKVAAAPSQRPNAAQIAEWKKKYGDVLHKIETSNGGLVILREPTPPEVEECMGKFSELVGSLKANGQKPKYYDLQRIFLGKIKLYEDNRLLEDAATMNYVLSEMDSVVKFVGGKVSKL